MNVSEFCWSLIIVICLVRLGINLRRTVKEGICCGARYLQKSMFLRQLSFGKPRSVHRCMWNTPFHEASSIGLQLTFHSKTLCSCFHLCSCLCHSCDLDFYLPYKELRLAVAKDHSIFSIFQLVSLCFP